MARELAAASPGLAVAGGAAVQGEGALELCMAVNILNQVAGNVGTTVRPGQGGTAGGGYAGIASLMQRMEAGQVGLLLVHEANPVYALPKSVGFAPAMDKVPFTVSTATYLDETAERADSATTSAAACAGAATRLRPNSWPVSDCVPSSGQRRQILPPSDGPSTRRSRPSCSLR